MRIASDRSNRRSDSSNILVFFSHLHSTSFAQYVICTLGHYTVGHDVTRAYASQSCVDTNAINSGSGVVLGSCDLILILLEIRQPID